MSEPPALTIYTDGAARGNPGPAAYAYVIKAAGAPPVEEAGCLGKLTNNQAEYTALVRALERAARLGTHHRLAVHSDSELLVKQMNGEYRVKNEDLRPLYEKAQELRERFAAVTIRHVPRAANKRADELCNEALDGRRKPAARGEGPGGREQALICLREAAAAWARGNPNDPPPEVVLEQICTVLEE
jgi:ribonuclease HI